MDVLRRDLQLAWLWMYMGEFSRAQRCYIRFDLAMGVDLVTLDMSNVLGNTALDTSWLFSYAEPVHAP